MSGVHAKRGASSSDQWIECAGSLQLIDSLPHTDRDQGSTSASLGSAAHNLGEACLIDGTDAAAHIGDWITDGEEEETLHEVTLDFAIAVQTYLDHCREIMARHPKATPYFEKNFSLEWLRPDMFGTADFALYDEVTGDLYITDYKNGRGLVEVEREDGLPNRQLSYYGLGGLYHLCPADGMEGVKMVHLTIVQPNAMHDDGPVRTKKIHPQVLWDWGQVVLGPAADRTEELGAPRKAGDHCLWCDARALCPEKNAKALTTAREQFPVLPTTKKEAVEAVGALSIESLGELLTSIPDLNHVIKAATQIALQRLRKGLPVPGHKLVRTITHRKYRDPDEVLGLLKKKKNIRRGMYMAPDALLSPKQMEGVTEIGKEFVRKHAFQPEGATTVARIGDRRKEAETNAQQQFDAIPEVVAVDDEDDLSFLD